MESIARVESMSLLNHFGVGKISPLNHPASLQYVDKAWAAQCLLWSKRIVLQWCVCMEMFIGWNWIIQTKALDGFVSFNLASSSFTGTLQFDFASDPVMLHYRANWKMLIALSSSFI